MTSALIFAALMGAPASPPPQEACLGVAIDSQHGLVNLVGLSVEGDETSLNKVVSAAAAIGAQADRTPGSTRAFVFFPSPPVTAANAIRFVDSVRGGEFGNLKSETRTMGIETLPLHKCPRTDS